VSRFFIAKMSREKLFISLKVTRL